jgi:hypothetical protein
MKTADWSLKAPVSRRVLIRNSADPLWRNSLGENLAHVHMHSFVEDYQVLRILEYSGLNIFSKDHSEKSILHHAAMHGSLCPETIAPDDYDEEATQITWPDTADETNISPQATTLPTERRSQRLRKTSYADILAQSKYDS